MAKAYVGEREVEVLYVGLYSGTTAVKFLDNGAVGRVESDTISVVYNN